MIHWSNELKKIKGVVRIDGDQTINGTKTFTQVVKGVTPINNEDLATKKYVDDHSGGGGPANPQIETNKQDIAALKVKDAQLQQEIDDAVADIAVNDGEITKLKTKDTQIEQQIATMNQSIQTNTQAIGTKAESSNLQALQARVQANETNIATKATTASVSALEQRVNTKADDSAVVKLQGNQSINGEKTFTGTLRYDRQASNDTDVANKRFVNTTIENKAVLLTGAQSISGIKTFSDVVKGVNPVADEDLATKAYVNETNNNFRTPYGSVPNQASAHISQEVKMGFTFAGKQVYSAMCGVGDITAATQIAAEGTIKTLEQGNFFLGLGFGIIRRENGQIHNLNAINNLPDQHASIIWYEPSNRQIKWYFNTSNPQLTNFTRRPFVAQIFYTKNA